MTVETDIIRLIEKAGPMTIERLPAGAMDHRTVIQTMQVKRSGG